MKMRGFAQKFKKGFIKNYRDYFALKHRLYPQFVFENNPKTIKDEIPVFTLHAVNPQKFEKQLSFLSINGYNTLKAEDFYECMIGIKPIKERTILLTFDDGWKNLYTTVFPLLKKFNFFGICFLIPNLISENGNNQLEVENQINKKSSIYIPDSDTLCNWEDIKEMHQSGIIDFESHSMNHYLIFTSSKIIDFVSPTFDSYVLNFDVPLIRTNKVEDYKRNVIFGTPIYEHDSRFSGKKRYFDDENLRMKCTDHVKLNGGINFFNNYNWRQKLLNLMHNYKNQYPNSGFFETDNELRENILNEFRESKLCIENKLNGKSVNHFCYPWWVGSDIASKISKEEGYLTNFWGVLPGRRTNKLGDDPYRVVRILSDDLIFRLPGDGRKSLLKIFKERLLNNYTSFFNRLTENDL
jgi:hypothetical protein